MSSTSSLSISLEHKSRKIVKTRTILRNKSTASGALLRLFETQVRKLDQDLQLHIANTHR
jgi:hypothetical protein